MEHTESIDDAMRKKGSIALFWKLVDPERKFGFESPLNTNCHPAPFNWNGLPGINSLMKHNKLVIAKHNGSYGTYTRDEAKVWQMTDVKPLNF